MRSLRDALREYVAVRRALGTELLEQAVALEHFLDFLDRERATFITTELAVRWACQRPGVQPATWARRLTAVRRFARWLSAFDPRTEVPPERVLDSLHRRPKPYIFTDQEIYHLMAEAAQLPPPKGLRARTYATLIGLLAATGLRPGEALRLTLPEVDLANGILAVRHTKFDKSRFVPIDESTRTALVRYVQDRKRLCPGAQTDSLFVSERGGRLLPQVARRTFALLSGAVGLRTLSGFRIGRGPRLQDIRHTFATRRLVEWYRAGLEVERELPRLATYLGHVSIASTYWYVEAIPELLQLATNRLQANRGGGAR
jgi:site-specific recombinase XerD